MSNWQFLAALITVYFCGVIVGMSLAFKIDEHIAIMKTEALEGKSE